LCAFSPWLFAFVAYLSFWLLWSLLCCFGLFFFHTIHTFLFLRAKAHQFAAAAVFAQAGKFGDARNLAKDCIERLEASEEADPEEIEQIKEFLDSLSKKDAPKAGQKERSKGKKSKSAAQSPLLPYAFIYFYLLLPNPLRR
jgi:hypothetical protein